MSPTRRSLALLRLTYPLVQVVEHWNQYARIRQDLFGFVDILAVCQNTVVAVQTTTASNLAARRAKILASSAARFWLESPTRRILIHGWHKAGPRGGRKTWQCRTVEVRPTDFETANL
jgi:hypothetical protein